MKSENVKDTIPCSIKFPVSIGDTVFCMVEDEEHVVEFLPYKVEGLAYVGDKFYVLHEGMLNEIDTLACILPQYMHHCRAPKETV